MTLASILWAIFVIVLLVWFFGILFSYGGTLINLLLIVAAAVLIYNLLFTRRAAY